MKPDYQTKNIRLAFWGIFAAVLIILLAMVLFAPAERPVGQAGGDVTGGAGGGGSGVGGVIRPGLYDRRSGDDVIVCAPSLLGDGLLDCSSGDNPLEDIIFGESSTCVMAPGTDGNNLLCDRPVTATGLLNRLGAGRIPKEPDQRCVHDCLQSKLGTEVECNRKCGGISDNGDLGTDPKTGLGCDMLRRCPDGKSFYGQKDPVTGNCTTIDFCPKTGGGGGSGGDGLVCAQVMPPKPRCGFGEVATFYGQTDKECAKWVCEKISPPLPNPDDCLPNSKSIKCIFWRIFG